MHITKLLRVGRKGLPLLLLAGIILASVAACQSREADDEVQTSAISAEATQPPTTNADEVATALPATQEPSPTAPPLEDKPTVATRPLSQEAERGPATATTSKEVSELAVNRIAYVGTDGNIFTIKPDGTDSHKLTTTDVRVGRGGDILAEVGERSVAYGWPAWSPDGKKLAVSRTITEGLVDSYSLEVLDPVTGKGTRIYDNEPRSILIAQDAPHYTYWSPDSARLTFLASTPRLSGREVSLFISTPDEGRRDIHLIGPAPIYFNWADDSSVLLIHWTERLMITAPNGADPTPIRALAFVGTGFRAPALSHDATKMLYTDERRGEGNLYLAETQPDLPGARVILDVGPFSAFLPSPTRDEVAISDITSSPASAYGRLTLVSNDGSSQTSLAEEQLLAFFWSPDGEKIVYIAFDPEGRTLTWKYVARSGAGAVELVDFVPSANFLTMIRFFDQYAYSNPIWSPDSSQIVFTGTVGSGSGGPSRNGSSPEGAKVYVLDVREGAVPKEIAAGSLAVWSWN